jgi:hypothetical protein
VARGALVLDIHPCPPFDINGKHTAAEVVEDTTLELALQVYPSLFLPKSQVLLSKCLSLCRDILRTSCAQMDLSSSTSGLVLHELSEIESQEVLECLSRAGFSKTRLLVATLESEGIAGVTGLLAQVGLDPGLCARAVHPLVAAITGAEARVDRERRRTAEAHFEHRAQVLERCRKAARVEAPQVVIPSAITPRGGRWPTRHKANIAAAVVGNERAQLEFKEQARRRDDLVSALRASQLPIVALAAGSADPDSTIRAAAGSKRASTIRGRLRQWRLFHRWMQAVHQAPWPTHVVQLVDYLTDLVAGGAPRSAPSQVAGMVSFMEVAGSVPQGQRLSQHPLWVAAVRAAAADLDGSRAMPYQAPQFPITVVASLELYVMDVKHPKFRRFVAWVRLVKVWSAMRSGDTEGALPASFKLTDAGLEGVLDRTKTSGPGRRVRHLPFFVSASCFIFQEGWLRAGYDLLVSVDFAFPRDYLVPLADSTFERPMKKMASYTDRAAYGRALLAELALPARRLPSQEPAPPVFTLKRSSGYWTEHSERNFLPSVAASLGIEKARRDYIGRWQPSKQSDDYVRSARQIVAAIQSEVASKLRADPKYLDEAPLRSGFAEYLCATGESKDSADLEASRLLPCWEIVKDLPGPEVPPNLGPLIVQDRVLLPAADLESDGHQSDDASPAAPPSGAGYWISITKRRAFRRLHRAGGCCFVPGVNVAICEEVDDPSKVDFDAKCLRCFREAPLPRTDGSSSTSTEESSSTEEGSE